MQNLSSNSVNKMSTNAKCFSQTVSETALYLSLSLISLRHDYTVEVVNDMPGIDEMPKSQIEKRKRNMESTSRVSRREMRNVEICFLVREENEIFLHTKIEISAIFSNFKRRNFEIKSHDARGDQDVEISNFS